MLSSMNDKDELLKDELTDRAIETLYDIIRRAQTSAQTKWTSSYARNKSPASPSSSALFNAYEQVLAEQGLQPSDDAVLHRFLFRMQENRRHNENIVQRFTRVLGEMNIQVEVNEEGEGVEVTSNLESTRVIPRNGAVAALGRHSRRSSFDSFFDGTADKVAGTDYGDLPMRARSGGPNAGTRALHGPRGPRRVRSDTEAHSYQQMQLPVRSKVNGYAHRRTASGQQQPGRKRSASVSSRGSLQIRRPGVTGTSRMGDYDADDSDHTDRTTSLDLSHVQVPGINAPIPDISLASSNHYPHYVPGPFQPSDTRLLNEAEIFEEQRLHRVTRACIQTWRNRTQERLSIREDMERLATAFDRRILLHLSFEQLRDTARVRRSNRETERFFGRLEERADRARNIFLLTKAFTHWAKSAEDEVQRTSVARRHILRTRFFNGWRDITAVNALKIQHFVLAKFLRQWRARTARLLDKTESAIQLYEDNLVRRIYKEWFFKLCAVAAPSWQNAHIRKVAMHKMLEVANVLRERQAWATDRWQRGVLRKTLQHLHGKIVTVQTLTLRAHEFRQNALLSPAFRTLQKHAQFAPLLRQFQERSNGRIVQKAFLEWRHAAQLSRQARSVDRMRVLHNAYTSWNDRLRIKALEDRINDRVIVEALYKWTLASRVSLFHRVHGRQLKENVFLTWVTKTNQRNNTLDAAERRFAHFKRAQMLRTCLRRMESIATEKRAEEFAVVADFQQRLKQRIFEKLQERHASCQQLNTWANAANFYVVSKSALKIWSAATQHARRNRRRDTYAQVRRRVKMNLVHRLFTNWREKSNQVAILNQQANDILVDRTMQSSGALLLQWHERAVTLRRQSTQAIDIHVSKLQSRSFRTWTQRLVVIQSMDAQAVALGQESAELAATSALKKLGWRLWNVRRQEQNARALYERNFEKHVRAMVRFWAEQTSERLVDRPVSPTPLSRSKKNRREDDDGDNDQIASNEPGTSTRPLTTWTAFDSNALDLDNDLDLSLSITPEHRQPPSTHPLPPRSILRPTPTHPTRQAQAQAQAHSSLRPIPEPSTLNPAFTSTLAKDLASPSNFWSGTPFPPLPTTSSLNKPGYLKTPSKRSIVRAKRPELTTSPQKSNESRVQERYLVPVTAPPARRQSRFEPDVGAITDFRERLRDGGFGGGGFSRSVGGAGGTGAWKAKGRGRGRGRGKARVGFEDVGEGE